VRSCARAARTKPWGPWRRATTYFGWEVDELHTAVEDDLWRGDGTYPSGASSLATIETLIDIDGAVPRRWSAPT
jgi:hypothetical protein